MALYGIVGNTDEVCETLQVPGAFSSDTEARVREILGGEVFGLCLLNCYEKGKLECLYHSRNPGCEMAEMLIKQYRVFLLLKENGHF